ncbi:MAG: methyltransferase domain-containing protein [Gammaproteobacteria bacterium]|nr:methyltransferase domain-containing protein [Gammaproteobacteria bacterium]
MSQIDRNKWNQRYAEDDYRKTNPVTLLEDWVPKLAVGRALDVACGAGRNALYLAQTGFSVDAIDIAAEGLKLGQQQAESQRLSINWIEHDLDEAYSFDRNYDLIVVMWYVNPALITRLCDCLAPGGYLICEEHLVSEQKTVGPRTESFRVKPGELRSAVSALEILFYKESVETNAANERVASAAVVAKKLK